MTASASSLTSAGARGKKATRTRGGRMRVVSARASDHSAISYFLTAVFQGPSPGEFKASLENPFYEPRDRLLIKQGSRIVAHAHLAHRVMQFGSLHLPISELDWLGTVPPLRQRGCGRQLLGAAEQRMADDGALVGLLRTRIPQFFRRAGWTRCGQPCHTRAGSRSVLTALASRGLHRRLRKRLNIRPWRRMEMGALVRIYQQNLAGGFGPLHRTEAYWQWLIRRGGFDQLCVALDGPDLLELEEHHAPIVGYSVTHGEKIVELYTVPDHPTAVADLLARACGDAIEHGRHTISIRAAPDDCLHEIFQTVGGTRDDGEAHGDRMLMAKLFHPVKLLRAMSPELHRRAEAAGLPRPFDLGLLVGSKKYRIVTTPRSVNAVGRNLGSSYLRLGEADFTRLVLGDLDWDQAISEYRVEASDEAALTAGRVLFPRLPLWFPPLDNLPARR